MPKSISKNQLLGGVLILGLMAGCSQNPQTSTAQSGEPDYITVQHILIGFLEKGPGINQATVPDKGIERSRTEAETLANDLLKRAQAGEDFDALVKEYTDDAHPGIYKMANYGIRGNPRAVFDEDRVFERQGMVPAFGNVGFPLQVDEIGMAPYDTKMSPYGFHIIKRIE